MPADKPSDRSSKSSKSKSSDGKSSSSSKSSRSKSSSGSGRSSKKSSKSIGKRLSRSLGKVTEAIEKGFKVFAEAFNGVVDMIFSILFPKALRKKVDKLGTSKKATRVTKKMTKRVGAITDKVEKQFTSGASGFFEIFGFLFSILVPKFIRDRVSKVWKAVGDRVSKFFKRLNKGLASWAEKYLPAWLLNRIKWFGKWWKRTRKNLGKFSNAWWKSRDFLNLAWSTPAILLSVPVLGALALASVNNDGDKILHYQRMQFQANSDENYELADLCRAKLVSLGFLRMEMAEFRIALENARSGNFELAYEQMKKLAPLPDSLYVEIESAEGTSRSTPGKAAPAGVVPGENEPGESDPLATTNEAANKVPEEKEASGSGLGISSAVTQLISNGSTDPSEAKTVGDSSIEKDDRTDNATNVVGNDDQEDPQEEVAEEEEDKGFLNAHLWIAQNLLGRPKLESSDVRRWKLMRAHAETAKELFEARGTRGILVGAEICLVECDYLAGMNVIPRMMKLVREYPAFSYQLMKHYDANRQYGQAAKHARIYIEFVGHSDGKRNDSKDNAYPDTVYAGLFRAYQVLGRLDESRALVAEGSRFYPNADFLQKWNSEIIIAELNRMSPNDEAYVPKLIEAHSADRKNEMLAKRLAIRLTSPNSMYNEKDIQLLIEEGTVGAELLIELGDLEAVASKPANAISRYERAIEVDPSSSRAYNNYAYVMADAKLLGPVSLERALKQVDMAIELEPESTYLETRGQIHIQMRQWEAARADLERALNGILRRSDQRSAHLGLAQVYQQLGQADLAKVHQIQADKLKDRTRLL